MFCTICRAPHSSIEALCGVCATPYTEGQLHSVAWWIVIVCMMSVVELQFYSSQVPSTQWNRTLWALLKGPKLLLIKEVWGHFHSWNYFWNSCEQASATIWMCSRRDMIRQDKCALLSPYLNGIFLFYHNLILCSLSSSLWKCEIVESCKVRKTFLSTFYQFSYAIQ